LTLLGLEELVLPDEQCRELPLPEAATAEGESLCERFLADNHWFNRLQLRSFGDESRHLYLSGSWPQGEIREKLAQLTGRLLDTFGQDDRHEGALALDDDIQIEEGFWLGRNWGMKTADTSCLSMTLQLNEPGKIALFVYGI
jgi:hypothetical protein